MLTESSVSIVIASGDSGVAGRPGDDGPNGCLGPNGTIFSPDFPVSDRPMIVLSFANPLNTGFLSVSDCCWWHVPPTRCQRS